MDNNNELHDDGWASARLASLSPDYEWQPNPTRSFESLQQRRHTQRGRQRRWSWTAAAIVIAGFPLMALPVTRAIAQRCVSACVEQSGRLRELLLGPVPASTYLKIRDRKMAPDFVMTDASGRQVSLSQFRGKAVLLNFWATWCGPCKAEIPMLKSLQQSYRGRDFTVLGVSLEEDGWNSVRPYMAAAQFNYPVGVGGEDISALYGGLDSIPTTLLIDKAGRIAALHVGSCNRSEYETEVGALLKE